MSCSVSVRRHLLDNTVVSSDRAVSLWVAPPGSRTAAWPRRVTTTMRDCAHGMFNLGVSRSGIGKSRSEAYPLGTLAS